MSRRTLSREDWLQAGFRALAQEGPEALKAERLARALGTTKGSFYWHFTDVPAFRAAMLDYWRETALTDIIAQVETEQTPTSALRKLAQLAARGTGGIHGAARIEPAIRTWAHADERVAAMLSEIDAERLGFLANLLKRCGVPNPDLARALYASAIGMEDLSSRDGADNDNAMGTLVDLILALR
jgi:AcrR family transcriptional regulator